MTPTGTELDREYQSWKAQHGFQEPVDLPETREVRGVLYPPVCPACGDLGLLNDIPCQCMAGDDYRRND